MHWIGRPFRQRLWRTSAISQYFILWVQSQVKDSHGVGLIRRTTWTPLLNDSRVTVAQKGQGHCGLKGSFRLFLLTSPPHPRQKRISIRSCDTFICITIHGAPSIFRRRARLGYFAYEFPIRYYTALKGISKIPRLTFFYSGGHKGRRLNEAKFPERWEADAQTCAHLYSPQRLVFTFRHKCVLRS